MKYKPFGLTLTTQEKSRIRSKTAALEKKLQQQVTVKKISKTIPGGEK